VTFLVLLLIGCGKEQPPETFLPIPDWMDSAELTSFNSVADIRKFWRTRNDYRADKSIRENNGRDFYKSCYYAIATHRDNEPLRVYCLASMGDRVLERTEHKKLLQNIVDNHYDFNSDLSNCVNCKAGDTVAGAVRKLAWLERHSGNTDIAIELLTTLLDKRKKDIPDYTQMNLYGILARFYGETAVTPEGLEKLGIAINELEPYRDSSPAAKQYFKKLETYYAELTE